MHMTELEIVGSFRRGIDKANQITILSQRNLCTEDEIREVLIKHGVQEAEIPVKLKRGGRKPGTKNKPKEKPVPKPAPKPTPKPAPKEPKAVAKPAPKPAAVVKEDKKPTVKEDSRQEVFRDPYRYATSNCNVRPLTEDEEQEIASAVMLPNLVREIIERRIVVITEQISMLEQELDTLCHYLGGVKNEQCD